MPHAKKVHHKGGNDVAVETYRITNYYTFIVNHAVTHGRFVAYQSLQVLQQNMQRQKDQLDADLQNLQIANPKLFIHA